MGIQEKSQVFDGIGHKDEWINIDRNQNINEIKISDEKNLIKIKIQ